MDLREKISKAKAIFFDMDGTIIHSEPLHFEAIFNALKALNIHTSLKIEDQKTIIEKYCGWTDTMLLRDLYPNLSHQKVDEIVELKGKILIDIIEKNYQDSLVIKGFYAFFNQLKNANKLVALVTASDQCATKATLGKMNIFDKFDLVVTRQSTQQSKPTPMPYLYALDQLELTKEEVIVFEDSRNGISSALAANLNIIQQNAFTKREFNNLPSIDNYLGLLDA